MLRQVGEHLSENRPLLDGLRRVARLDKLSNIVQPQGPLLGDGRFALRVDGVAILHHVSVGIHLTLRTHAQIANGAFCKSRVFGYRLRQLLLCHFHFLSFGY
nr:hypothetical protein [Actinomadura macra]